MEMDTSILDWVAITGYFGVTLLVCWQIFLRR